MGDLERNVISRIRDHVIFREDDSPDSVSFQFYATMAQAERELDRIREDEGKQNMEAWRKEIAEKNTQIAYYRDALKDAVSIIGELMGYDNWLAYPTYLAERVEEFIAPFDAEGI